MTVYLADPDVTLYHGDVLETLQGLPDESVDCVVTSPPYWGLRDYGTGAWVGGDPDCDHLGAPMRTKATINANWQAKNPGGDPDEVTRQTSLAESQAGLNGPSGSPTSPPGAQSNPYGFRGSGPGGPNPTYVHQRGATLNGPDKKNAEGREPFKDRCGKCGASRVDQQLGLEPTPDVFVARMVEVFREIRRVLAAHGTCWVNLGDSYASTGSGTGSDNTAHRGDAAGNFRNGLGYVGQGNPRTAVGGLKPKDLVGAPWRVAFALQQPYYTGRIKDERDRIWLAAMVEAEGCMFIHKRKVGQTNGQGYERKSDSYGSGLEVASTDRAIVERCMAIAGKGSIGQQTKGRNRTLYRWMLRSNECRDVIRELYPHMVAKQHEARLLIGCPSSGPKAAAAHTSLMALHNGQPAAIDFLAPDTLFEPGWYVRSDVIWSKLNPMPESVTDRPTKAHEYVFLLTKQPRYFFDQEAVREPAPFNTNRHMASGRLIQTSNHDAPKALIGNGDPPTTRNIRSVWEIATQPYPEAHFATYPEELVRRCLLAGCPEWVCRVCGTPRERITSSEYEEAGKNNNSLKTKGGGDATAAMSARPYETRMLKHTQTLGWSHCAHSHRPDNLRPGVVLDPFIGSGTTAHVARKHGRHAIGIDLNADYLKLAARRLQQLSLFAGGAS